MPSTERTPHSGVTTSPVQPERAQLHPSAAVADSSARTTVVPTAITRPPPWRASQIVWAVCSGTSYHSGNGGSWLSGEDTPACRVIGAMVTPRATRRLSNSRVNGRPALGISALPGLIAYTFWYAASGQGLFTWE